MKKLFALVLAVLLLLSLFACGKGSETNQTNSPTEVQTKEPTEQAQTGFVDAINMDESGGSLAYLGYEFVPEDFYLGRGKDSFKAEDTVVFKFLYNNHENAEKNVVDDYNVKVYQNGAELDSPLNYNHNYSVQAFENKWKKTIQNGKIEVGFAVVLEDDSPVTIICTYKGESHTVQKSEVILDDIPTPIVIVSNRSELFGQWVGINTGIVLTLSDSKWEFTRPGGGSYANKWVVVGNSLCIGGEGEVYTFKIKMIDGKIHLIGNPAALDSDGYTDEYVRK